jgi:hypothetical protein
VTLKQIKKLSIEDQKIALRGKIVTVLGWEIDEKSNSNSSGLWMKKGPEWQQVPELTLDWMRELEILLSGMPQEDCVFGHLQRDYAFNLEKIVEAEGDYEGLTLWGKFSVANASAIEKAYAWLDTVGEK